MKNKICMAGLLCLCMTGLFGCGSSEYGMMEILRKAGLNTVLGMGTVFVVLIFISFIISLLKYVPGLFEKRTEEKKEEHGEAEIKAVIEEKAGKEEEKYRTGSSEKGSYMLPVDDPQLVAVIAAAIAAFHESDINGNDTGFVVRSIRRRPGNWR